MFIPAAGVQAVHSRGGARVPLCRRRPREHIIAVNIFAFCGLKSFLLKVSSEVSRGVIVVCFCYLIEFFVEFMNTWLM
jgi:hypothetical protein